MSNAAPHSCAERRTAIVKNTRHLPVFLLVSNRPGRWRHFGEVGAVPVRSLASQPSPVPRRSEVAMDHDSLAFALLSRPSFAVVAWLDPVCDDGLPADSDEALVLLRVAAERNSAHTTKLPAPCYGRRNFRPAPQARR